MNFVADKTWSYWVAVKHFIFYPILRNGEKSSFNVNIVIQTEWLKYCACNPNKLRYAGDRPLRSGIYLLRET